MSDKEKVSGEEVEVFGYWWEVTGNYFNDKGFARDEETVEKFKAYYARMLGVLSEEPLMTVAQHQRITEALRGEVERKQREIDLLWSDRRKDAALIAELRAQLSQQQGVPDGYVLVPVEPTLEMANASVYNGTDYTGSFDFDDFKKDWTDILAAAPAPAPEVQAETASELYTCIGKGGEYSRIGTSLGAGECRGESIEVYRDTATGQLYHRESVGFFARMQPLPPAPEVV